MSCLEISGKAKSDMEEPILLDKIINLAKRRQFVFPASEIYGGLAGFYDFGPNGTEMKNNLKRLWWDFMVRRRENVVGIDGAVITHPTVWEASGHLKSFTDPLVECQACKKRFRADTLESEDKKKCPECGGLLSEERKFNLMMHTELGVVEGQKEIAYLRGEACQSIYLDYNNVLKTSRLKIPFGICQIGKAFRNEITPKNFLFRVREFEQWDLQYFVAPEDMEKYYEYWKQERMGWFQKYFNIKENLRFRQHASDELAHYAKVAFDIEYNSPFGWKEMEGIHWRGDWDLSQHGKFSGIDFTYTTEDGRQFIPNIVETSGGVDRTFLFLLLDAYNEELTKDADGKEEVRVYLKLHPTIAPITVAVLPLIKDESLIKISREIRESLLDYYNVDYDQAGSIGKRYRRQDEIGTPFAVTVDFDTLKDDSVTIRLRDSMKQERVKVTDLCSVLKGLITSY